MSLYQPQISATISPVVLPLCQWDKELRISAHLSYGGVCHFHKIDIDFDETVLIDVRT